MERDRSCDPGILRQAPSSGTKMRGSEHENRSEEPQHEGQEIRDFLVFLTKLNLLTSCLLLEGLLASWSRQARLMRSGGHDVDGH